MGEPSHDRLTFRIRTESQERYPKIAKDTTLSILSFSQLGTRNDVFLVVRQVADKRSPNEEVLLDDLCIETDGTFIQATIDDIFRGIDEWRKQAQQSPLTNVSTPPLTTTTPATNLPSPDISTAGNDDKQLQKTGPKKTAPKGAEIKSTLPKCRINAPTAGKYSVLNGKELIIVDFGKMGGGQIMIKVECEDKPEKPLEINREELEMSFEQGFRKPTIDEIITTIEAYQKLKLKPAA